MPDQNGVVEIKDFTLPDDDQPKQFRVRDDVFYAVSTIPIGLLPDVVALAGGVRGDTQDNIDKLLSVFDVLLWDDSAKLLRARVVDKKKPISDKHIGPIVHWLLEQYGLRPTQPSDDSSSSSDGTVESTTSTDGASHVVSISAASPSLGS